MKINYPTAGWPAIIDEDVNTLSDNDIQEVGKLLLTKAVVVFKDQKLSIDDQIKFMSSFGNLHEYSNKERVKKAMCPESSYVAHVTGKKSEDGLPGLHGGVSDLDWHCNNPWQIDRKPNVYLYAINGSLGSRTSYSNLIKAFNDLPIEWQQKIKELKLRVGRIYDNYSEFGKAYKLKEEEAIGYNPTIHQKNHAGLDTIYFPFLQIYGILGYENNTVEEQYIIDYLKTFILQEKYIYHHDWHDGDIVLADQWSGLHKRWKFDDMENRLLHRIVSDYSNLNLS